MFAVFGTNIGMEFVPDVTDGGEGREDVVRFFLLTQHPIQWHDSHRPPHETLQSLPRLYIQLLGPNKLMYTRS